MDVLTPTTAALYVAEQIVDGLTHLAVGDSGLALSAGQVALHHEIGRTRYLERAFVTEDNAGPIVAMPLPQHVQSNGRYQISPTPTSLVYFRFRFEAAEAIGTWREFAIFAGDVAYLERGATLANGAQAGDDQAGVNVLLGGGYTGPDNQTITVTCSASGPSGVAKVQWASTGSLPPASLQTVTFGSPRTIGSSGLSLTFTGGGDQVLSAGDSWIITARKGGGATYAANGLYDPVGNQAGEVLRAGRLFRLWRDPVGAVKSNAALDLGLVVAIME